jgi:hypothetical protein
MGAKKEQGAKKEYQAVAKMDEQPPLLPMVISPARLIDEQGTSQDVTGLPEEFKGAETLAGFPPSAKFDKPGDCVFGEFIGMREGVGPNASRLYELSLPDGAGSSLTVAVWGSAALDRLFDSAYPPVQTGDRLAVIFLGEKSTKRGLNPVRLFQLKVKRPSKATKTVSAA